MTARYFVPDLPRNGGTAELPEAEAHHARNVMRVQAGQNVMLFDGRGHEATAMIQSVTRGGVSCEVKPAVFMPRRNSRRVAMAVAMPKGDRSKELIERLTELGVDALIPIHCIRSPWAISEGMIEKWRRVMIEACKQSGRNTLMEILPPRPLTEHLNRPSRGDCEDDHSRDNDDHRRDRWIAQPSGAPLQMLGPASHSAGNGSEPPGYGSQRSSTVHAAIGPEGGFTDEEIAAASRAGWTTVGLGERIYRIETAAIILAVKAAGI